MRPRSVRGRSRSVNRDGRGRPLQVSAVAFGHEIPSFHVAFALDRNSAAVLAEELVLEQLVGGAGDLDAVGGALRFHAAGRVDRVAPEVVKEALATDDAGDHRS